MSRRFGEGFKS